MFHKDSRERLTHPEKYRLIMTLLVRDEADIIRQNIDFHLSRGVDFIIATDNGSIDGTRVILEEYEKKGLLHLIVEKKHDNSQADWVNRMGEIAYEGYKADIIFHCDADEFWHSKTGDLRNEFLRDKDTDVLFVNLINVLLQDKKGVESFPEDARYAVVNPIETDNFEEDSKKKNLYLFRYPPKVIFKTSKRFLEVIHGNHNIAYCDSSIKTNISQDMMIYHYPVRNKAHFYRKIRNGGSALLANDRLGKETCWHWRRWYASYQKGLLDKEYEKLTLKKDEIYHLINDDMIKEHAFNHFILNNCAKETHDIEGEFYTSGEALSKSNEHTNLGNAEVNKLFVPVKRKQYICNAGDINPSGANNSLSLIVNYISKNSTVLDVGCSYGYLGEWLAKNKNCKVYGIDIDSDALNSVKAQGYYSDTFLLDLDSPERLAEEFNRFKALGEIFDFAVCADVLEHLKNPMNVLAIIAPMVKFSGQVVVSVPNISNIDIILNLLRGKFNYSEFGILDNTHLRFFTKGSFAEWISFANDAFEEFKLDLKLIGSTKYISEFVSEAKDKYPVIGAIMSASADYEVLQNVFALTKVDKLAATKRLDVFLSNIDVIALERIQCLVTPKTPLLTLTKYFKVKSWLMPQGSRRRRIVKNIWNPERVVNGQHMKKSISYIREHGFAAFLRKIREKLRQ